MIEIYVAFYPPKTAVNDNDLIAMKFDIETACTLAIIMGYIILEIFSKKGVLGVSPLPPSNFFLKIL